MKRMQRRLDPSKPNLGVLPSLTVSVSQILKPIVIRPFLKSLSEVFFLLNLSACKDKRML